MQTKSVRKHFTLPAELHGALTQRRLSWHLESPSRLGELDGIASLNAFVVGLLQLGLESIDNPVESDRLWQLLLDSHTSR